MRQFDPQAKFSVWRMNSRFAPIWAVQPAIAASPKRTSTLKVFTAMMGRMPVIRSSRRNDASAWQLRHLLAVLYFETILAAGTGIDFEQSGRGH